MSEPGDNITSGAFRWQREMESMPAWTVTVPWLTGAWRFSFDLRLIFLTEEGLPKKGIVNFIYSSDAPNHVARRSLLTQVLLDPRDDASVVFSSIVSFLGPLLPQ